MPARRKIPPCYQAPLPLLLPNQRRIRHPPRPAPSFPPDSLSATTTTTTTNPAHTIGLPSPQLRRQFFTG
ncbi:MAG: hypothetical protein JNJ78_18980 [Anaerolineae bacterium]|nr:hypothetical protein [Anaerolineae bacterium]